MATASVAEAQTSVPSSINTTRWTPGGNPYVIIGNPVVESGHILTIDPGVIVWIGESSSLTINGLVEAVGRPDQRITFQAPVATQRWGNIVVNFGPGTNRFKYCDFRDAETALRLSVSGNSSFVVNSSRTMPVEIINCTFEDCASEAVAGEANGTWSNFAGHDAILAPIIKNCVFRNSGGGLTFRVQGETGMSATGLGFAQPRVIGNIFADIILAAVVLNAGSFSGASSAVVVNNTFVNCGTGVDSKEPWNTRIQNNIFSSSGTAVGTSGLLSRSVGFNCFSGNQTNFAGYPAAYGQVIFQNRNGVACDLLFNIFEDPLFAGTDDFHLGENSPCIDAGDTADPNHGDTCFDVSRGTGISDLGAYGGPDACNWLDMVPLIPTTPWMTIPDEKPTINWDAIPRSRYRIQYLTNVTDNQWKTLTEMTAVEKPTVQDVSSLDGQRYFRVQSLGRRPGD
jgi:hypothetical protein